MAIKPSCSSDHVMLSFDPSPQGGKNNTQKSTKFLPSSVPSPLRTELCPLCRGNDKSGLLEHTEGDRLCLLREPGGRDPSLGTGTLDCRRPVLLSKVVGVGLVLMFEDFP